MPMVDKFTNTPGDINDPKHTYFYKIYWLVHSYIALVINTPNMMSGAGIVKLYAYRMGVLSPDTEALEQEYIRRLLASDAKIQAQLTAFGNGMICYNLATLYLLLAKQMIRDIQQGVGNTHCLSSEAMRLLYQFVKSYNQPSVTSKIVAPDVDLFGVVETLHYNANFVTPGVSSISEINSFLDVGRKLINNTPGKTELERRHFLTNLLKAVFYIGIRYYDLNLLRFDDQRIGRPYDRNIPINNFTLAAIPFDPVLMYSCTEDVGSMSRFGVEYMQSLEEAMTSLGGISCTITLAA